MSLGRFGGAAPIIRGVSGYGGSSQSGLDQARDQLDISPEGDLGIRQEIASGELSAQASANAVDAISTTSGTRVDMPTMTLSPTIVASNVGVLFLFSANVYNGTAGAGVVFAANVGGTEILNHRVDSSTADQRVNAAFSMFDAAPSAGARTYKVQWNITGGGTANADNRRVEAVEFRR